MTSAYWQCMTHRVPRRCSPHRYQINRSLHSNIRSVCFCPDTLGHIISLIGYHTFDKSHSFHVGRRVFVFLLFPTRMQLFFGRQREVKALNLISCRRHLEKTQKCEVAYILLTPGDFMSIHIYVVNTHTLLFQSELRHRRCMV